MHERLGHLLLYILQYFILRRWWVDERGNCRVGDRASAAPPAQRGGGSTDDVQVRHGAGVTPVSEFGGRGRHGAWAERVGGGGVARSGVTRGGDVRV